MRSDTEKMSDAELLRTYIESGRSDYFGILFTRYTPLIYGLCLKYLRNVEEAEDAVMQIFEELMPKVGRYEIGQFRTWVYSVARNHCLQQLRKRKPQTVEDFPLERMESDDIAHLLSENNEQRLQILEDCIEKLPEPQKISIRLFFLEEKSYVDVADATRYHLKSVKSYIQNGKRNLKNCIEKGETA